MAEAQRRRSQRHPTNWVAKYRVSADAPWRKCRIVDMSAHGATVELHDLAPGESFRYRIDLRVLSMSQDAVGVMLRAQIYCRSRHPHGLLVGVEFVRNADRTSINLLHLLSEPQSMIADA